MGTGTDQPILTSSQLHFAPFFISGVIFVAAYYLQLSIVSGSKWLVVLFWYWIVEFFGGIFKAVQLL